MQGRRRNLFSARFLWLAGLLLSLAGFLLFGRQAQGDCDADRALVPLARLTGQLGPPVPAGTAVTVAGTVTGVFPGRDGLDGFFIQQQRADQGASAGFPPTGLFVYAPGFSLADWERVRTGSRVQVDGLADEHRGWPQVQRVAAVRVCGSGEPPEPLALTLPADRATLRALHGVLVSFPQPLTVTGNYTLGRYGSLRLSQNGRLFRHQLAEAGQEWIILDDGSYRASPEPVPYLDRAGTRRAGDTVASLSGILAHAFDDWRIHPTAEPRFINSNPRPASPAAMDGLRVATFNLDNYFLSLGGRGARDTAALERQRGKLLAVLEAKDADLLALVEVENRREVLEDLVDRLNARLPGNADYQLLDGPVDTGDDAIKVALIYRASALEPQAAARADNRPVHHRPPVMAAFRDRRSGKQFIAAVVHFKAKSRCPDSGDIDRGQGCWNQRRTAQAHALVEAVARKSGNHGIPYVLLAGDFNSYAGEDPIRIIENAGYRNLVAEHLPAERHYSYVFRGEAGTLDYIFANAALAAQVTGANVWHINADEPRFLAYDQTGGHTPGSRGQPWRSSDHDPISIGIGW